MKKLFFLLGISLIGTAGLAQQIVNYQQSTEIITNPERGFYAHHQSMNAGTLLNKENLIQHREQEGISLILMLYYLPEFMDGPISKDALANMESNFNIMREAGVKCVLRFAYKSSQSSHPWDPPVEIVEEHIKNITPVIRSGSDVIAVVQTGFVGVWGEWYYTDNFGFPSPDFELRNKVVNGLLNALPERRMIQLRTPNLKYGICNIDYETPLTEAQAYSGIKEARIGHHNDCFLASSSDYGTYANLTNDKAFLEVDTRYLPMGGETCNPSSYSECENAITQMERFHWSYLNSDYHATVLNGWSTNGCMGEVKKRLGYRLVLQQGNYTAVAGAGGCFQIQLSLSNVGFAAPFNPRDLELILVQEGGDAKYWVRLPDNPQFWLPGETIEINHQIHLPDDMPDGEYRLYLNLPDPEPELFDRADYSIQLANLGTWEAETGYNDLLHTVHISSTVAIEECQTDLSFLNFPRVPHLDLVSSNNDWNISDYARLFPNPVASGENAILEMTTDNADQAMLNIMSITGQRMIQRKIDLRIGHNRINLQGTDQLPDGLYYVIVSGEKSYLRKKMTIQ